MKPITTIVQDWDIPEWSVKHRNEQRLESILNSFNLAGSANFYFLDYFRRKIIIDSPLSLILRGHSKADADEQGFEFFKQILSRKEQTWLSQLNEAGYEFFLNYPKEKREGLLISYDLTFSTAKGEDVVLHHHLVPYRLCRNGNLWLGLCCVWASSQKESGNAAIYDRKTKERYNFINKEFVKVAPLSFTEEELAILGRMVTGLSDKEIGEQLNISSLANFKRKKKELYKKLQVFTSAGAVHKAHLLGLI